ncbi:MAG: DUF5597 domain-containing protein [Bryobacteraceae bacterium]
MKVRILSCATFVCSLAVASDIPHLQKQGTATQLVVDGKPFLALAGELHNSSATGLEYMKPVWPKLAAAKLNTVLAGVSWNQIEPQEGKFNFSVVDGVIQGARSNNLHLVLLWFASWKNGLSSYPPDWVKRDFKRFPRIQIQGGKTIELLSPFSDANRDADARAYAALMRHVKEVDGQQHTVVMIQVENEINVQRDSRDRSPVANQAYAGPVPKVLMDYLQKQKNELLPEVRKVWEAAGFRTSGTWEEVFGKGVATDQLFMAWYFARYVNRVAEAGKGEYPIPMYVNGWMSGFGGRGHTGNELPPERVNSGGPEAHLLEVWQAGAPRIDIVSGDLYSWFVESCAMYARSGNPIFIPETQGGQEGSMRALYAFGRYDAIGYSPFGVDGSRAPDDDLIGSYDLITQLTPLILANQGKGTMSAVFLGPKDPPQKVRVGNYTLEAWYTQPRRPATPAPQETQPFAGAIFIATGPDEYFVAGRGVSVTFSPNTPGPPLAGFGTVEEGKFVNGRWVPGRQLAGDETEQGDNLSFRSLGIQRVTLYRYE